MARKPRGQGRERKPDAAPTPPAEPPAHSTSEAKLELEDVGQEPAGPSPAEQLEAMAAELGGEPGPGAADGPNADDALDAGLEAAERIMSQPELAAQITPDEMADMLELVFELVALRRGEHWRLEAREKDRLAKWLHKSAERHGGLEWLARYAPDIITGALLAGAVYRRVKIDRAPAPETVGM